VRFTRRSQTSARPAMLSSCNGINANQVRPISSMLKRWLESLPWQDGRQGTGYKKIRMFESKRLRADCYLLYYPTGTEIPVHVDRVLGNHYRLNIILKQAKAGGEFQCAKNICSFWRIRFFRSDFGHSVSKITSGYRLLLSFGWVR